MIVTVTGLMRTGTSTTARMLHQMGVPMGSLMRFPVPGTDLEWEDAALAEPLLLSILGKATDIPALFRAYIESRRCGTWGVKTPFLMPYLDEWRDAVKESGESVRVILCTRQYSETLKSFEKIASHYQEREAIYATLVAIQEKLSRWEVSEAENFPISDLRKNPDLVASRLACIAGVEPCSC